MEHSASRTYEATPALNPSSLKLSCGASAKKQLAGRHVSKPMLNVSMLSLQLGDLLAS